MVTTNTGTAEQESAKHRSTTLYGLLQALAETDPERPFLALPGKTLSRGEIYALTTAAAQALADAGATTGDRVLVFLNKSPACVAAIIACTALGAIAVPAHPSLRAPQLRHILVHSGASVVVTSKQRWATVTASAKGACDQPLMLDEESLCTTTSRSTLHMLATNNAATPSVLLYTSGSTGMPKGILLSCGNLEAGAASVSNYLGLEENDRIAAILPFSFDAGLSQLTAALATGASILAVDYFHPKAATAALHSAGVTVVTAVPGLWTEMLEAKPIPNPHVRVIASTGGSMSPDTLAGLRTTYPNASVFIMYGFTEAFRTSHVPLARHPVAANAIGIPNPQVQVDILDEHGKPCPPGRAGELVQFGPLVTLGYWNDPELTQATFFTDFSREPHWQRGARSGDLVSLGNDGMLYWHGRLKQLVKIRGIRVSAAELEWSCQATGMVRSCAAVAIPRPEDSSGDTHFLALAAVPATQLADVDELVRHLRSHAPPHLQPQKVCLVDALPLNDNGKVDGQAVARLIANEPG